MSQQEHPDQQEEEPVDPEDRFVQALIALALVACLATMALVSLELNRQYGVTFGGVIPAPEQTTQGSS